MTTNRAASVCRLCGSTDFGPVINLGVGSPGGDLSNTSSPWRIHRCGDCLLVQSSSLITALPVRSSSPASEHLAGFVADVVARLGLGVESFVVDVGSDRGQLLQHVVRRWIRCLGIEPSVDAAAAARDHGVPTLTAVLGYDTAAAVRAQHGPADLVCVNEVLSSTPDPLGLARGMRALVADDGWISAQVQHVLALVASPRSTVTDPRYMHYFTLLTAMRVLSTAHLAIVDVDVPDACAGSIRMWVRPHEFAGSPSRRVYGLLAAEDEAGLHTIGGQARLLTPAAANLCKLLGVAEDDANRLAPVPRHEAVEVSTC